MNTDVLLLIVEHLDVDDLLRLAATCRHLYRLVHDVGWSIFLRNNPRSSLTLHASRARWTPLAQVRYDHLADRAWSRADFVARPLARPWHGILQPSIALSVSTLLVAAGRVVYAYAVQECDRSPSRIVFDRSYHSPDADITSLAIHPDTAFLGFADGAVERLSHHELAETRRVHVQRAPHSAVHRHEHVVQSISCTPRTLLSLSQWGSVLLTNLDADAPSTTSLDLGARSWTSHLCTSYAAFGTVAAAPLSVYYITPHGFSSTPSIVLRSPKNRPSAVYGITCAPPSSPLGPSEHILVSGWYDGSVRIYDLRVAHPGSSLLPVLTLHDPWSPEPIYAVSCGGGHASFVAAGTARHSIVAFWDVRHPSRGWSVHAPGNDSSPVYSLVLESSRLFGATQSRPFVYDFGPGVTKETYPHIAPAFSGRRLRPGEDKLKLDRNGIGYHVLKYSHRRMAIF